MTHAQFCYLVGGVLAQGKLLPSPKLIMYQTSAVWLEFSGATITKSLKEATNPTWVVNNRTRYGFCVQDNVVPTRTTWCPLGQRGAH